jgi:competence protein ComEA
MDDAIRAAGGLATDADTRSLNRAALITDGEKIYVYSVSEATAEEAAPPGAQGLTASGKVNINTASTDELLTLNGVGPATAGKIIDYRTKNGNFKRVEDIMNVSGIGEATFEKLREHIAV